MLIANPIYDVIFKYLLEDLNIARDLLSAILDEQIVEISVYSQEISSEIGGGLSVLRMDFKAVIATESGERKTVLIELQKVKKLFDITRFRRYLGENYRKGEEHINEKGEKESSPLPIITIYFLGFRLDNISIPVLKVDRVYVDAIAKTPLPDSTKEAFVEQLTHDCYVVQIPLLSMRLQTPLEHILQLFNQKYITKDKHTLDYEPLSPANVPLVQRIIYRLQRAIASDDLRTKMDVEDEFERIIDREMHKELAAKDQIIEEKKKTIEEKEKTIEEKEKTIEEKEKTIALLLAELDKLKER